MIKIENQCQINVYLQLGINTQQLSVFNFFFVLTQYNKDFEIGKTNANIYEAGKDLTYVPCVSPVYNVAVCPQSPFVQLPHGTVSGLIIANHTAILKVKLNHSSQT